MTDSLSENKQISNYLFLHKHLFKLRNVHTLSLFICLPKSDRYSQGITLRNTRAFVWFKITFSIFLLSIFLFRLYIALATPIRNLNINNDNLKVFQYQSIAFYCYCYLLFVIVIYYSIQFEFLFCFSIHMMTFCYIRTEHDTNKIS